MRLSEEALTALAAIQTVKDLLGKPGGPTLEDLEASAHYLRVAGEAVGAMTLETLEDQDHEVGLE